MKQEIAGQPLWLWAVGAAVIVGGYLYFKHTAASATSPSPGAPSGGGGKSSSTISFKETIKDMQGPPTPGKKKGH